MWVYQYAYLKYALLVSRDYRCSDGHLIHDRTQIIRYADVVWC